MTTTTRRSARNKKEVKDGAEKAEREAPKASSTPKRKKSITPVGRRTRSAVKKKSMDELQSTKDVVSKGGQTSPAKSRRKTRQSTIDEGDEQVQAKEDAPKEKDKEVTPATPSPKKKKRSKGKDDSESSVGKKGSNTDTPTSEPKKDKQDAMEIDGDTETEKQTPSADSTENANVTPSSKKKKRSKKKEESPSSIKKKDRKAAAPTAEEQADKQEATRMDVDEDTEKQTPSSASKETSSVTSPSQKKKHKKKGESPSFTKKKDSNAASEEQADKQDDTRMGVDEEMEQQTPSSASKETGSVTSSSKRKKQKKKGKSLSSLKKDSSTAAPTSEEKAAKQDDTRMDVDEETPPADTKEASSVTSSSKKKKHKKKKEHKRKKGDTPSSSKKKRKRRDRDEAEADETPKKKKKKPTKPPPSMDVSVHRVRNLEYMPKPVLCMATTPFDKHASDYVALSRDNGSVELVSPDEKWKAVATIEGMSTRTIDVMTWTCGKGGEVSSEEKELTFSSTFHESHTRVHSHRTLIGASRNGTIFIVDFAHGRHTSVTGSGGGGVFSLASLCGSKGCCSGSKCCQLVAAGCQDGHVRIYRVPVETDDAKLELVSTVPCAGTAILSLAWRRISNGHGSALGGTVLYAGVADGTIRRLDCVTKARSAGTPALSTGSVVSAVGQASWKSKLRMTVESYGRATPTRVWVLQALADGTLISGDSLGHVQFWDGNTGTLLQTFDQNDNKADVLALAVSSNECRVFCSGVDSRIVLIERDSQNKWVMTHAQRPHTHDVKAMAMCRQRDQTGTLQEGKYSNEVLCSGGVDTKLCTYIIKDFGKIRPKNLYPWPSVTPIFVATEARVLGIKRDHQVDLYKLAPSTNVTNTNKPMLVPEEKMLIGSIELQKKHNLVCADISSDGKFLGMSDSVGLTLFRLDYSTHKSGRSFVEPTQVTIDRSMRVPYLAAKFVSSHRLACASFDGPIHLLQINEDDSSWNVTMEYVFAVPKSNFAIHSLSVSPDGAWLASARSGLEGGTVQVYSLTEGSYKNWWSLPSLEAPVSCIRFLGGETALLAISCVSCALYVFDVEKRCLGNWSEKLGVPMWKKLPTELSHRPDFPIRLAANPATPNKFLLGFFGAFSAIDMDKPMGKHCRFFPETHVRKQRNAVPRKSEGNIVREGEENSSNCTICLRYTSMLFMDFLADNEMLVVEQPWLSVVASFPEALERKVYGT